MVAVVVMKCFQLQCVCNLVSACVTTPPACLPFFYYINYAHYEADSYWINKFRFIISFINYTIYGRNDVMYIGERSITCFL